MKILLWAEFQKLRRSNIILFTVFAIVFTAVDLPTPIGPQRATDGRKGRVWDIQMMDANETLLDIDAGSKF